MKIEVWKGKSVGAKQSWFWHFRQSNGQITADSEVFPTKAHAIRAAKAVVRAVCKPILLYEVDAEPLEFSKPMPNEKTGGVEITWSCQEKRWTTNTELLPVIANSTLPRLR
jgi:uncharacterized protein YegP (UPF0339 family)